MGPDEPGVVAEPWRPRTTIRRAAATTTATTTTTMRVEDAAPEGTRRRGAAAREGAGEDEDERRTPAEDDDQARRREPTNVRNRTFPGPARPRRRGRGGADRLAGPPCARLLAGPPAGGHGLRRRCARRCVPAAGWIALTAFMATSLLTHDHAGAALLLVAGALVPVLLVTCATARLAAVGGAPALGAIGLAGAWPGMPRASRTAPGGARY